MCDVTHVGCYPWDRLYSNLKSKFNLTFERLPKQLLFGEAAFEVSNTKTWQVLAVSSDSYLQGNRDIGPHYGTYVRDNQDHYLLYCENGWRTENEGFLHWTQPFAASTWWAVGATVLLFVAVGCIQEATLDNLINRTFLIIAIILRAPVTTSNVNYAVFPVIVCLSLQFLSLRYESTFTTLFTVPPPPAISPNLRHLILDRGFKMVYPVHNHSYLYKYDLYEFKAGFSKANIKFNPDDNVQILDPVLNSTTPLTMANPNNKLATDIPKSEMFIGLLLYGTPSYPNGKFCHYLGEPFFRRVFATKITGRKHRAIILYMNRLREIGVEAHWHELHKLLYNNRWAKRLMTAPYAYEMLAKYGEWNTFQPMELSGKFIQFYIISAGILSVALIVFITEVVYDRFNHSKSV